MRVLNRMSEYLHVRRDSHAWRTNVRESPARCEHFWGWHACVSGYEDPGLLGWCMRVCASLHAGVSFAIRARVNNGGEKKMIQNVCAHISSRQIELESPGWSGLVRLCYVKLCAYEHSS